MFKEIQPDTELTLFYTHLILFGGVFSGRNNFSTQLNFSRYKTANSLIYVSLKPESELVSSRFLELKNMSFNVFCCQLVTIFAVSGDIPIVAIEPLLNFRKSVSIPSLKITPFVGINDSIVKTFWFFITPAVIPVCVLIL